MIRLFHIILYTIKGLLLKLSLRGSLRMNGVGRIAMSAKITTSNNGSIELGQGVRVCAHAKLSADGGKLTIGENVGINPNMILHCHGRITIGDGTLFAPNVCIYDHNHRFDENGLAEGYSVGSIEIGRNCLIGVNVTILKNTKIGDGCVIGAG
ncbi:MAG: acyltransferase, partial [Clostridia bacterium]|nr:acyltransferase [Clostridia bacterium]